MQVGSDVREDGSAGATEPAGARRWISWRKDKVHSTTSLHFFRFSSSADCDDVTKDVINAKPSADCDDVTKDVINAKPSADCDDVTKDVINAKTSADCPARRRFISFASLHLLIVMTSRLMSSQLIPYLAHLLNC
ncbi:hypothetical protein F511_33776 [Dorcoceras hygrometricum]|uniref:Uncharacterized protein n=1 Tax=Dorcoceras hygrometricum TaxID=472368 RepID=A0A2Z7AV88_9LAMI|nr:hypothetical protein F511_33776 [Dorcoceras hygrometricum]